jgi:hypothetical protein
MMYWNSSNNWSWALMFWGSQALWIVVFALRAQRGNLFHFRSAYLLIPFGYALPMLKYQMDSYYPRHLVAINLAFMCAALIAWPQRGATPTDVQTGSPTETAIASPNATLHEERTSEKA